MRAWEARIARRTSHGRFPRVKYVQYPSVKSPPDTDPRARLQAAPFRHFVDRLLTLMTWWIPFFSFPLTPTQRHHHMPFITPPVLRRSILLNALPPFASRNSCFLQPILTTCFRGRFFAAAATAHRAVDIKNKEESHLLDAAVRICLPPLFNSC